MASGGGKPPPAPDPAQIIALQSQYNRYNQKNPFGEASWSTDPNGHETLTTTPSERTQGAIDRAFASSETPFERLQIAPGLGQLAEAIMGRVGSRYGLGDANPNNPTLGYGMNTQPFKGNGTPFNTDLMSAKGQQQAPPTPQMQNPSGGRPPMPMQMGG